jgi:serine/threonine protein kinase/tetratricopeptide (TPR) repeat protein
VHSEQWALIKDLLATALALPANARPGYLSHACAGDISLQREVEDLLAASNRTDDFLEQRANDLLTEQAGPEADLAGRSIGHYNVVSRIGSGATGDVYLARDDRLDRRVALKRLAIHLALEPQNLFRFRTEARAASGLNHPNILIIHDVGDLDGRPFIVSEFVEGETLRARLTRGRLAVHEAVRIAAQIADALAAAHERGILHRDIKPENVMVRPDGHVKILDFGLAKLLQPAEPHEASVVRTLPGLLLGTPRYMSPEQARGLDVDARSDIWSVGVVLYEMLAARPPFEGGTPSDVIAAILHFEPQPLDDDLAIPRAVTDILTRTLEKDLGRRFGSVRELYAALECVRTTLESGGTLPTSASESPGPAASGVLVGRVRLMVLPFRLLASDPGLDFLRFSLADAIVSALSEISALTVRSSLLASRFGAGEIDLTRIAAEADVNVVLNGTIMPSGDRVRVGSELIEAPGGRIVWATSSETEAGDFFQLQDRVVTRIVESLARPLTVPDQIAVRRDVPSSTAAYESYLRANELARHPAGFEEALGLYRKCLDADPRFAPAWARLGRLYRVIGKYSGQDVARWFRQADEAFERAMSLNPELSVAQNNYAYLQVDMGRAVASMVRLLTRARRRPTDADLYAGLVHACRYAGLLDASAAAHRCAIAIDPLIPTTALQTYFMRGELDVALDESRKIAGGSLRAMVLSLLDREAEAIAYLKEQEQRLSHFTIRQYSVALRTLLEGDRQECLAAIDHLLTIDFPDPEGLYWLARYLSRLDDPRAQETLDAAIDGGFNAVRMMRWDPWLERLRGTPSFDVTARKAGVQYRAAVSAFVDAGGTHVLGPASAA